MRTSQPKSGRTFAVAFDHGNDTPPTGQVLPRQRVGTFWQSAHLPTFLAGFAEAAIVGT